MAKKKTKKKIAKKGFVNDIFASLSVLFGITFIIPAAIVLVQDNKLVRFYAFQSMLFFAVFIVLQWFSHMVSRIIFSSFNYSLPIVPIVTATALALWLLTLYKAWMGDKFDIPILGSYAEKLLKNFK